MKEYIMVLGIDFTSSKEYTIFNGDEFEEKDVEELEHYLNDIEDVSSKILISWHARKSFSLGVKDARNRYLYQKKIEEFSNQKEKGVTLLGITVRAYEGNPHWAMSQYLLGYPRPSIFERSFRPAHNRVFNKNVVAKFVTEINTTLPSLFWDEEITEKWRDEKYKNDFNNFVEILKQKELILEDLEIKNSKQINAYFSWKLAIDWVQDNGGRDVLSESDKDSFIFLYDKDIFEKLKGQFQDSCIC